LSYTGLQIVTVTFHSPRSPYMAVGASNFTFRYFGIQSLNRVRLELAYATATTSQRLNVIELQDFDVRFSAVDTRMIFQPLYQVSPVADHRFTVCLNCLVYVLLTVFYVVFSSVLLVTCFARIL